MVKGMEQPKEQYRSHLVEQYCPYVGYKILGFVTYRFVPVGPGEPGEIDESGEQGDKRLKRELVRANCLQVENCPDLGCQRGRNPLAS